MDPLLVLVAALAGGLLAVQAAANLQLSTAVGSPVGASTLQLAVAAVLLTALAALAGTLAALGLLPQAQPWHLLGGLGSALFITAGILLFPRLGALASVGLFVTGQMLASLALDAFGLLGVARDPLGSAAAGGALAVIAGIGLIVRAQGVAPAPGRPARAGRAGWVLLGLLAGAALPSRARSTPSSAPTWTRRSPSAPSASPWPPPPWRWCCWPSSPRAAARLRGSPPCAGSPGGAGSAASPAPPT